MPTPEIPKGIPLATIAPPRKYYEPPGIPVPGENIIVFSGNQQLPYASPVQQQKVESPKQSHFSDFTVAFLKGMTTGLHVGIGYILGQNSRY